MDLDCSSNTHLQHVNLANFVPQTCKTLEECRIHGTWAQTRPLPHSYIWEWVGHSLWTDVNLASINICNYDCCLDDSCGCEVIFTTADTLGMPAGRRAECLSSVPIHGQRNNQANTSNAGAEDACC